MVNYKKILISSITLCISTSAYAGDLRKAISALKKMHAAQKCYDDADKKQTENFQTRIGRFYLNKMEVCLKEQGREMRLWKYYSENLTDKELGILDKYFWK